MKNDRPAWNAVIPLRAGSKGLPGKNTRLLCGKPLYVHAVQAAWDAGATRVVITTDIPDLLAAASNMLPIEVIARPAHLCSDDSPMAPVLVHAIQASGIDGLVGLLQATSPLRIAADILAALAVYQSGGFDLVMSVTEADRSVLKWGRIEGDRYRPISDPAHCFANRQTLPKVFRPNGAVYIMDAAWFLARGNFVSERIGVTEMPADRSLDIDHEADWAACERILSNRTRSVSTT